MKNKLKQHPRIGTEQDGYNVAVPQNILDCVHSALLPYHVPWDKVQDAILSPDGDDSNPEEEDCFLSTNEVADILHVSRGTLFRYMKAGKIRAYKLGRRNLFSRREVFARLKNGGVPNV